MLEYFRPPVEKIQIPFYEISDPAFFLLREDLNHPTVSGNKWWKLKLNLLGAKEENKSVVTFGGAFSNHIHATAHACKILGIQSYGIIRGERAATLSPTLIDAEQCGMKLQFISREIYQNRNNASFLNLIQNDFPSSLIIPEGGSNELAVQGCALWAQYILDSGFQFDHVVVATGTGSTLAGLIRGFEGRVKVTGIAVLKNGYFLNDVVKSFLETDPGNWEIQTGYHFGGYALRHEIVDALISGMLESQNIPLDFVYTGKMMAAVSDLARQGYFNNNSRVLLIHSGGLQGNRPVS